MLALLNNSDATTFTFLQCKYTFGKNRMQSENVTPQHDMELATITQEAGSMMAIKLINRNRTPLTRRLYVEYNIIDDSPTILSARIEE
jgi:hypothetical protein